MTHMYPPPTQGRAQYLCGPPRIRLPVAAECACLGCRGCGAGVHSVASRMRAGIQAPEVAAYSRDDKRRAVWVGGWVSGCGGGGLGVGVGVSVYVSI
jgi:hypothetical protein